MVLARRHEPIGGILQPKSGIRYDSPDRYKESQKTRLAQQSYSFLLAIGGVSDVICEKIRKA